jgi:Cu/Ag efflux protein CusF
MRARFLLVAAAIALAGSQTLAQSPAAINVNGVIEKIDAESVSVKTAEGAVETFKLAPNLLVIQVKTATLADIKPNDFVASAAVRKEDGKLHSTELRIFPDAMRGVGEGQRPMNDARNQTMTNATVTGAAVVGGSNNLKVMFPGGESELILDPGVPVVRMDAADKGAAKAGVKARAQGAGGTVTRLTLQ